ncbi:hypothetical protein CsatB_011428 [Cannabis sativa]
MKREGLGYAWGVSAGFKAALAAISAKLFTSEINRYGLVPLFNLTMVVMLHLKIPRDCQGKNQVDLLLLVGQEKTRENKQRTDNNNNHEAYENIEEMPKYTTHNEKDDGYASETDDEHHKYDESNIEDDMKEDHHIREGLASSQY